MPQKVQLNLTPADASDEQTVRRKAAHLSGTPVNDIKSIRILKRSIDSRTKNIRVNLEIEILTERDRDGSLLNPFKSQNVSGCREVIIVGAGPAGLFAALRLIELGLRPVILERGKEISRRKRDIAMISRAQVIDPDSNYCFGEGGAGTFSDGKLYTRSRKRGDNSRVLELLCLHGANRNILYEAHPHLGTDKLPAIITRIKSSIVEAGGILLFDKKVTDLIINNELVTGVVTADNERFRSPFVLLATGHSAHDIYETCMRRKIELEMKAFAAGVRVEHPQELIDRIQYHGNPRGNYLPAASYNLVRQSRGRGIYSFCMCPGGFIVPAATAQEEVVVNGMSPSERNSSYANSGIVVEIRLEDLEKYSAYGELAGLAFQKEMEHDAWIHGGRTQRAPAQRLADFVSGKSSSSLPKVSYTPGVTSSPLHEWLPETIAGRLMDGFSMFGRIMKGFLSNEAVILGVESRTSSPVRIPRNPETMEHVRISGLYPCGEGSGYSGGIVSSAVDGVKAAEAIALKKDSV
ncbi:MAG: FAD-binding protein [Bacteroidota bacterium]|nr:FAD-binding protein [Bacteroidota bacterium]